MDCNQIRPLLDAAVDAELDLVRQLEIEHHLASCAECARFATNLREQKNAVAVSLPRFTASSPLAQKIRDALDQAAIPFRPQPAVRPAARTGFGWRLTGLAASLGLIFVAGASWGTYRARGDILIDAAVSSHVRSLQLAHLIDVASTDQHTVKPWFTGKLDFSPPVADLAADGFPLAGGRLEYFAGQPAAALVFHRRLHTINLFIQPVGTTTLSALRVMRKGSGYQVAGWLQDGFNFIAVSEIPEADLKEFAGIFQRHTAGGGTAR
jgi:anti-sigma factor RsiW